MSTTQPSMSVLVTGATGFIGARVAHAFAHAGHTVIAGGRRPSATGAFLPLDLSSPQSLPTQLDASARAAAHPITLLVHCAAMRDPATCERDRFAAVTVNFHATRALARWSKDHGARMLFLSTDQVFDGAQGHYHETDPRRPMNHYGVTKALAEDAVWDALGPRGCVARIALTLGHSVERNRSPNEHVVQALRAGRPAMLYDNEFRSPIHVDDVAQSLLALAQAQGARPPASFPHRCVHVGGARVSRIDLGVALAHAFRLDPALCVRTRHDAKTTGIYRPLDCSIKSEILSQLGVQVRALADAVALLARTEPNPSLGET